jgi:hypothetical protein
MSTAPGAAALSECAYESGTLRAGYANGLLTNRLAGADMGRHSNGSMGRKLPAQRAHPDTTDYATARRQENQLF